MTDAELLKQSKERFVASCERDSEQRLLQEQDLKFVTLDQWDTTVRNARENDINGPRPCLTIDKLGQYRTQIINNIRKNKPAGKVRGVDNKADPKTAEIFQGIVRHIDDISKTDIVYETSAEWAIDTGEGYWRYVTEYLPGSVDEQEIYRRAIPNGFSVYGGPHMSPDGSDAQYWHIFEDIPQDEFKRLHPGKDIKSEDFDAEGMKYWMPDKCVRVCEYLYYEFVKEKLVKLSDGRTMTQEEFKKLPPPVAPPQMPGMLPMPAPMPLTVIADRESEKRVVKWCKHTGTQVLKKQDWPGKFLPVVKVVGHQKMVEGKKKTWGIVRPAIDSCRMYNFVASTIMERIGLTPLNQFIASEGQISGREQEWRDANRIRRAVLLYKREDVNGNASPPPQRAGPIQSDPGLTQQLQIIEHDIKTSLGMFKASVGEEQGDQSGRAIRALQSQSDTATFHFPNNLAVSVRRGLEIELDLIPKVYDVASVKRIIGEDGKAQQVKIDPEQPQARRDIQQADGSVMSIYNLNVGLYDVTPTTGPSYATGRQEVAELVMDSMKNNPALMPVIGDLGFRALDNPVADQIADRLAAAGGHDQKGAQIPPQVKQQMDQMQQALQGLQQENQQLKSGAMEGMAKVNADAAAKQKAIDDQRMLDEQELALKQKKQADEAKLARDKAIDEFDLKKWVAEQEIAIDKMKADHAKSIKDGELALTKEKFADEQAARAETDVMPKLHGMLMEHSNALAQKIDQSKPGNVRIVQKKDGTGRVTGGTAHYDNGDVREVTLQ